MKPGRPLAYGRIAGATSSACRAIPVAAMVTFYEFVRDALLVLLGALRAPLCRLQGALASPIRKAPGRTEFQRGILGPAPTAVDRAHDRRSGLGHPVVDVAGQLLYRAAATKHGNVAAGDEVEVLPFEALL